MSNQTPFSSRGNWPPKATDNNTTMAATKSRYSSVRGTSIGSSTHQHSSSLSNFSFNKTTIPKPSQRDIVRNPWDHTFIIPVECGRPNLPEMENRALWANPELIKLRDAQRSCVCAGLEWEIYIHPNRGHKHQYFGLTVLPIRAVNEKENLPDNYKIRFTVTARAVSSDPRSKSTTSTQPYQWEREINQISSNFDPKDQTTINTDRENTDNNTNSQNSRSFSAYMEQLPFSIEDLTKHCCIEYEGNVPIFRLAVEIRCIFVRKKTMNRAYHGLMGAILMEEEQKVEKLEKELEQIRQNTNEKEKKGDSKELSLKEDVKKLEHEKIQQNRKIEELNSQIFQIQELNSKELKKLITKTLENDKEFRNLLEREKQNKEQIQQQIKEKDMEIKRLENRLSEIQGKNEQLNQEIVQLRNEKSLQTQLNESMISVDHRRQRLGDEYFNNNFSQVSPYPYTQSYSNNQANYNKSAQKPNEEQLDTTRTVASVNKQNQMQMEKEEKPKNQVTGTQDDVIQPHTLWHSSTVLNSYKLGENNIWNWVGIGQLSLIVDEPKHKYRLILQDYRTQQYVINTYVELDKIEVQQSFVITWPEGYSFYSAKFPSEEDLREFLNALEHAQGGSRDQSSFMKAKKSNEEFNTQKETFNTQNQPKTNNKPTENDETEEEVEEDKRTESNYDKHESTQQHDDETNEWDFSNLAPKNDDDDGGWGSSAKFDFGNITSELNNIEKDEEEEEEKEKDGDKHGKETQDEDNCLEFTVQPIANLKEVAVASGHENEDLIASIPFKKLFVWGKDVTKESTWKIRATSSQVEFWQDRKSKKIRMTCLEEITQKLRINHWIPPPDKCQLKKKTELAWNWTAVDVTIAEENSENEEILSSFSIKFGNMNEFALFEKTFTDAQRNNEAVKGGANTAKITTVQERESAKPNEKNVNTNVVTQKEVKNEKKKDKSENEFSWSQPQPTKNNTNEITSEQWEEMERKKKNAEAQKAAGLFGDNTGDQMGGGATFQFDMNSSFNETVTAPQFEVNGGVDLEFADHIPKADVSFGVGSEPENKNSKEKVQSEETTNVWSSPQKESHETDDLDRTEFANTEEKPVITHQNEKAQDKKDTGGFEKWTGGFSDFTNNDQSGFDADGSTQQWSFANESNDFDFSAGEGWGSLTTDTNKKNDVEQFLSEQPEGEDNCLEYTLKPIVELQEQAVPTGTEEETKLHTFAFKKLHRWGKDVTGQSQWKVRASDSSIEFWKNNKTGKIRLICREHLIEKLRMNQNVPANIKITEKNEVFCQWTGVDLTIAEEDSSNGLSLWLVKFDQPEVCKQFQESLRKASINNKETKA